VLKKILLLSCAAAFLSAYPLYSQVPAAGRGGSHLIAGGIFSEFQPDYGPAPLLGFGFYADFNVGAHLSAEAEGRFLRLHQTAEVHEDTYLIGPRYRWHVRGTQPYVKFLLGNGQFNFPFSFAHGGYAMFAPGGGLDMPFKRRFLFRADYEYQHWESFQGSSLAPNGFSFGIGYRIF
jgi:hypothetical protein